MFFKGFDFADQDLYLFKNFAIHNYTKNTLQNKIPIIFFQKKLY